MRRRYSTLSISLCSGVGACALWPWPGVLPLCWRLLLSIVFANVKLAAGSEEALLRMFRASEKAKSMFGRRIWSSGLDS